MVQNRWCRDVALYARLCPESTASKVLCPACQQIRDDDPGGIVRVHWSQLNVHAPDIEATVRNVEARTMQTDPLERVMKIRRRDKGEMEIQTTNDQLAQRIGWELVQQYRGTLAYRCARKDMLLHVEWTGPDGCPSPDRSVA